MAEKAVAKPKAPKLFDRIGTYFDARHANGREGLILLDECIRRAASKDRDWDALARFVSRANMSNNSGKVKKIVRAAFGNAITFKLDKKHKAGGVFSLSWDGAFPLAQSNTYSLVKKAIDDNKSWDDKDFLLALAKVIPDAPKADKVVDEKAQARIVKHLKDYLTARMSEGFSAGELIAQVQKELAAAKATGVEKKMVNGVTVFTPDF